MSAHAQGESKIAATALSPSVCSRGSLLAQLAAAILTDQRFYPTACPPSALHNTFETHADIGVVGAKLVGTDHTVQEAGAIIWADGSGAWFNKYQPLLRGKRNEVVNHRVNYLRETDYVSAAAAMVPRALFIELGMFDMHFSPGYYEDTDLSFAMRGRGLRVLYNPFAHVVHMAHSTYQASMEPLMQRNLQQFKAKWREKLLGHAPACDVASACWPPNKQMYTHLAATRMYTYRVLWLDMVLPEPDRDSGSVRTLTLLKLLLAMRCHVSIASVQRSGNGRHERYTRMLQYLGVHVIPDVSLLGISARPPPPAAASRRHGRRRHGRRRHRHRRCSLLLLLSATTAAAPPSATTAAAAAPPLQLLMPL